MSRNCLVLAAFVLSSWATASSGCSKNRPLLSDLSSTERNAEPGIELASENSRQSSPQKHSEGIIPQIFETAREQDKLVMIDFVGSDWCPPCQKLEVEVFQQTEFREWAADRFIVYKADFPKRKTLPLEEQRINQQLRDQYQQYVTSYPTVLVVDSSGRVLTKMGYQPGGPQPWIQRLESQLTQVGWNRRP